ncbi:MAG TPA: nuclear transport factor 2 family protein [Thermoanaerobaculia bacterium]|nr:nuclear transport factor 2 family protein [Thermoanaerobaculia bacterium]
MARITLALLLCFALLGCATTGTPAGNEQVVRSIYEAFARGDGAAVIGALDPNVHWMEAENIFLADRNPYIGPQAVAEGVFGRIAQAWSDFRVTTQDFVTEGDTVVVMGRYAGKFNATGRSLDAQFVHVWTLANGKVVKFQQYADTEQFARVVGP